MARRVIAKRDFGLEGWKSGSSSTEDVFPSIKKWHRFPPGSISFNKGKHDEYARTEPPTLEKSRRQTYNLTETSFRHIWRRQEGKCAICGIHEDDYQKETGRKFCIDHDHSDGRVRGLLCRRCNLAIGLLEDNPDTIKAAAVYLEKQKKRERVQTPFSPIAPLTESDKDQVLMSIFSRIKDTSKPTSRIKIFFPELYPTKNSSYLRNKLLLDKEDQ